MDKKKREKRRNQPRLILGFYNAMKLRDEGLSLNKIAKYMRCVMALEA